MRIRKRVRHWGQRINEISSELNEKISEDERASKIPKLGVKSAGGSKITDGLAIDRKF